MIYLQKEPVVRLSDGTFLPAAAYQKDNKAARNNTMAWKIISAHNVSGSDEELKLKFDLLASPDDNYSSILQEVRAMGCERFELPWIFTNCHNALACTGGTINNDDHVFGYDCVRKYGGIYVPPYSGVIHQYIRERAAAGGQMILASDSHTRYGCLGAMGIGEGGTEVARQAVGSGYELKRPEVIAVCLTGKPAPGVGPMDLALKLIRETFRNGFCKNKVLEVMGPGISELSMDFRFGFDAMATESACFSTIWETDKEVERWFAGHERPADYREMCLEGEALYDGLVQIDLSRLEPMIALPFHPSHVFTIRSLCENETYLKDVLEAVERDAAVRSGGLTFTLLDKVCGGRLKVQSATIGGCVGGTYENVAAAAQILEGYVILPDGLPLGIYPASHAVLEEAERQGVLGTLLRAGAVIHPCVCGPCFGTTDVPANNSLAIRHVTRNYYSREGSRPDQGQLSASALMDARSIAATVRNGGRLTAATEVMKEERKIAYGYDGSYYEKAVYDGFGHPKPDTELRLGPNIADWPELPEMKPHLLLKVAGCYDGSITTDELCPSGEASSLRSNPERISEYTLLSRDQGFVQRAKAFRDHHDSDKETGDIKKRLAEIFGINVEEIGCGNLLVGDAVGDGSSREQAASNQKILGGWANLALEYSTKRYRSNCISWGLIPLQSDGEFLLKEGEYLFLPNVKAEILSGAEKLCACVPATGEEWILSIGEMTGEERKILAAGSLINYYRPND